MSAMTMLAREWRALSDQALSRAQRLLEPVGHGDLVAVVVNEELAFVAWLAKRGITVDPEDEAVIAALEATAVMEPSPDGWSG